MLHSRHMKQDTQQSAVTRAVERLGWLARPAVGLFLVALLPRLLGLGRGLTTDEAYHWVGYRSPRFLDALTSGQFADTMITGHPGVITMWLGSIGLVLERGLQMAGVLAAEVPYPVHLTLMRLPLAVTTAGLVVVAYCLLRQVIGRPVALLAALLWATDPFLVAHSRVLHLDALLAMLMLVTICGLLAAGWRDGAPRAGWQWQPLVVAGVAGGLAAVTKAPSALLAPITLVIAAGWWWHGQAPRRLPAVLRAGVLFGGVALLTAWAAWPALWVAPLAAIGSVINEVIDNGGAPHPGTFLLGQNFLEDEPGGLFYPLTLLARTTPWVLIGWGLLVVAGVRRWQWVRRHAVPLLLLLLAAGVVVAVLSLLPKKFDRYALPAVPLLHVLAAAGLWSSTVLLAVRWQRVGAVTTAAAVLATLVWYHPYYLAYYSPLVGGTAGAAQLVPVGWGEGLDIAGEWLAPRTADIADVRIATWSPPTLAAYTPAATTWQGELRDGSASHLVIYINQQQTRKESQYFGAVEAACQPLHTVWLHGVPYAAIYRVARHTPQLDAPLALGSGLTLAASVLVPPPPCQCGDYTLTLVLEPPAPPQRPAESLFVFVHARAPDGSRAMQVDLPLAQIVPPEAWGQDAAVPYTFRFAVPRDAPAARYDLVMGLYDPQSGGRVVRPDGSDSVVIGSFEHLPDLLPTSCNPVGETRP